MLQTVVMLQMGSERINHPSGKEEAAGGGKGQGSMTDLQIHSHNTRMLVGGNFFVVANSFYCMPVWS